MWMLGLTCAIDVKSEQKVSGPMPANLPLGKLVLYLKDGTGCVLHLPLAQVCTALIALPGEGSAGCLWEEAHFGSALLWIARPQSRAAWRLWSITKRNWSKPQGTAHSEIHPKVGKGPEVALLFWKQIRGMGRVLERLSYQMLYLRVILFFLAEFPCVACRIRVPWPRIEPGPRQWKHRVLTTGSPGSFPMVIIFYRWCSIQEATYRSSNKTCYCVLKLHLWLLCSWIGPGRKSREPQNKPYDKSNFIVYMSFKLKAIVMLLKGQNSVVNRHF